MVVVDVDDAARRVGVLGDLVDVVDGRQPGPDVKELADAPCREMAHHPAQESPVLKAGLGGVRNLVEQPRRGIAVSGVVVFAVEQVIVDPGYVRDGDVKDGRLQARGARIFH